MYTTHLPLRRLGGATLLLLAGLLEALAIRCLDHRELAARLQSLQRSQPDLIRLKSLARTARQHDVWLVEVGRGDDSQRRQRPALLVVAGLEGNDHAGTACAVAWLEGLASACATNDALRGRFASTTLYVFPRLNPETAMSFFARPRVETAVNSTPFDDDQDGLKDEDGPEDLNGDGVISWMRVEDPEGELIPDPVEPRLMVKADRMKNERGAWRLWPEGRDHDRDEAWNEDGPGGVNFNRNFPFNYRFFAPGSGTHQVSEGETRALADFFVAHPNISIAFTFGAADNLAQPPKAEGPKRPQTSVREEDLPYYRELGKAWREALGLQKELAGATEPGTFSDWVYFHRGRLSLAARAWSPALQLELAKAEASNDDKAKEEKPAESESGGKETAGKSDSPKAASRSKEKKPEPDKRNEEERAFLKWVDQHAPETFVPWKPLEHPDFRGKRVEIGGFAPFAKTLPPEKWLGELAERHGHFLTELTGKLPRLGIRKTEAKHLGKAIYELRLQVENTGYLPTALAHGEATREVHPTRVILKLDDSDILSGARIVRLGAIAGNGGWKEVRWVVHATERREVEVEVVSMLGGSVAIRIELREGR